MEATREIYWNVGRSVAGPMYLATVLTVVFFAWGIGRRLSLYRIGTAINRFDRCDERFRRLIVEVLGQKKVARERDGGRFHARLFWTMGTLFAGTLLVMIQDDLLAPFTGINILSGAFYKVFSLVLDMAGLAAFLTLGGLSYRRFIRKPEGLETVSKDYVVHLLLFAVLITGFLLEGARIAVTEQRQNPGLALFSPVGYAAAHLFTGFDKQSILTTHKDLWWVHFALTIGIIGAIPFTKLRHVVTTSANAFFAPFEPMGSIATINLEAEEIEQYGAAEVTGLSWKDIFDADACTGCKRCQDHCPVSATGKPLSPMKLIKQIGEAAENNTDAGLIETIGREALWSCTTCGACQDICPANVEHVNKIIEMRRNLVLMQGAFPGEEVRSAMNNMEVNGNPFGLDFTGRGEWVDDLPVILMRDSVEVDILYFAGCYASFDKRNQEVARNFVRICAAAGVRVGILGKEENCCGEPVRKLGNEYLYQMLAAQNIELIKEYGVKKIVTTCPHCFNTLARDYKDLGLDLPVEHYSTFVARLLKEERLMLAPEQFDFTYHDSCYLGRYQDITDEPRMVLRMAGGRLTEMTKSGYDSFCCGAGGGRILAEEKIGDRINVRRIQMAKETGAPLLVSNCPFCLTMFEDGIKMAGCEGELVIKDLAEVVAERIA